MIESNLTLIGGYAGVSADGVDPDAHEPAVYRTLLTGDLAGDDAPESFENHHENAWRVVHVTPAGAASTLRDLTIAAGNAPHSGGGLGCDGQCAMTLINITFYRNQAMDRGGAVHIPAGQLVIDECRLIANRTIHGTGAALAAASATITNCIFEQNAAGDNPLPTDHAAVCLESDSVINACTFRDHPDLALLLNPGRHELTDCLFTNNFGAISIGSSDVHSTANITHCNFLDSTARAISAINCDLTVHDCAFLNNSGQMTQLGGAIAANGTFTATDCQFIGNTSLMHGGAIYLATELARIVDCQFIENHVPEFGGAIAAPAAVILENCLFVGNAAANGGALAVYNLTGYSAWLHATNCEFRENIALAGGGAVWVYTNAESAIISSLFGQQLRRERRRCGIAPRQSFHH